ncbi:MAG: hypothetical protein AMS25_09050 [Gemmatimonas sp. SM23_52]|nr:MAG: hypothetical protein AMS25_09050 [Gemmatimonas sp. SM23_52]
MKLWRKSWGGRGLRVYVFERRPGSNLYREIYVNGRRVEAQKSLGHRDKARAEAYAFQLLARDNSRQDAWNGDRVTLRALFDMYAESPAFRAKKDKTQREDRGRLKRVVQFLGEEREVRSLTPDDVERFRQARTRGEVNGKKVRARAVAADLVALQTMLNWATRERNGRGDVLLGRNPLGGVRLPAERNPRRPVETFDRYVKLMEVAGEVDWRLPLALTLAESTGRRIGAILKLRRQDVDASRLPHGWLRFRAEHDKTGHEQWVPLTADARRVLLAHLRELPEGELLFPGERSLRKPVDVSVMSRCLREAYEEAELEPLNGSLWHAWRRKWATERKGMPVKDVAEAGGWRDTATLLASYQQSDESTLTQVVLEAPKLTRNGVESTPNLLHRRRTCGKS